MELAESDELMEFTPDELSAVIRDDGGSSIGKRLSCLLDDNLGVSGPHGWKEFPGHGIAVVSVDNAAHVVEGTCDLVNAAISAVRGKHGEVVLYLAAALPGIGMVANSAKAVKRAAKVADGANQLLSGPNQCLHSW